MFGVARAVLRSVSSRSRISTKCRSNLLPPSLLLGQVLCAKAPAPIGVLTRPCGASVPYGGLRERFLLVALGRRTPPAGLLAVL